MKARIITIEGIDQSGKRTQARLLANRLRKLHHKVGTVSLPIYESSAGQLIRRFLEGKQDLAPEAVHMLYSLNRWENKERLGKLVEENDFVIMDRYTPSNLAYGTARNLDLIWLENLDKGLPRPDLVVVLDTPVPSSFSRKSEKRDVHERNKRLLEKVRRNYKTLSRKFGWRLVDASKPVDRVGYDVWNLVHARFNLKSRQNTTI